jgi:hypothetical protein
MGFTSPSSTSPAEQVRALSAKKDSIQLQLDAQLSILKANNATLHTPPLVDAKGFPRDDIDVWAVRHARVRVIELRNDLDKVMQEIATALVAVYDPTVAGRVLMSTEKVKRSPFAKVGAVAPGGPAAEAVRLQSTQNRTLLTLHRACNEKISFSSLGISHTHRSPRRRCNLWLTWSPLTRKRVCLAHPVIELTLS